MKALPLIVILAVSLGVMCAIDTSHGYKPVMWRPQVEIVNRFLERHRGIGRFRRQSSDNCSRAFEEYVSDRFQSCFNTVNKILDSDITNNDLKVYCDNNCNSEIIGVSTDLAVYCDDGEVSNAF